MKKSCIPNIFTFINLSCGVISLLLTSEKKFILSSVFILLAGLVDRYDGRIARFLNVSSELGKELDSLSDLVSFGVAPSLLMYTCFNLNLIGPRGLIGVAILITVPICGAFRLARYNTSTFNGIFTGVPITIIGCFLALLVLVSNYIYIPVILSIVFMILGSYLMVSNIKLKKV